MRLSVLLVAATLATTACKHADSTASAVKGDLDGADAAFDPDAPLPPYEPVDVKWPLADPAVTLAAVTRIASDADPQLALADDGAIGPDDRFFMVIFGYQGVGTRNLPRNAHTFGLFARLDPRGRIARFQLSWNPADGVVKPERDGKQGSNFSFEKTLGIAAAGNAAIQHSLVVRIDAELYTAMRARYRDLARAEHDQSIQYKMLDDDAGRRQIANHQRGGSTNCIHAIMDALLAPGQPPEPTGLQFGFRASDTVFAFLRPHVLDAGAHQARIAGALGI